ncbi:integrator complex subunit 2 [Dermatophagoides farinae]|uniref:integrator complex subunit 2 n=1 Tax=Dermatophagoides farinae TaxID=6954 RepID=UPI003F63EA7F
MSTFSIPSSKCFDLIQTLNFDQLDQLSSRDIRYILPCLVRMCHCDTIDSSRKWLENRRKLKRILTTFPEANDIRQVLDIDYVQLESEVKKDLQLRLKSPSQPQPYETYLLSSVFQLFKISNADNAEHSLIKIFEHNDQKLLIRMKLVLNELLTLFIYFKNQSYQLNQLHSGPVASELFDTDIYLDEIVDLIYFAISEMPSTFQLFEIVETLLIVKNGLPLVVRLVANFPESFHEICSTLINNSDSNVIEEQNFISSNRVQVLRKLCQMNQSEALLIRSEAIELCRMPNLIVMLTLDHIRHRDDSNEKTNSDVLSFLTGILLSNDDKIRTWFSQYIKRKNLDTSPQTNCFLEFREQLLRRFRSITETMMNLSNNFSSANGNPKIEESIITEACLMLRLYCALRGVAMMKLNDEETQAISKMIVCRPPHIDIGVRFVSVGLCMILAFPKMIISQETEIIEWIKWLVKEENYFGQKANTKASFGEMLLLIAIFFHSNQLTQIGELVSSTIGIKHSSRTNELTLIKHIFIQDIFTEQTVTAHAIKVPVTKNLNDSITGALPIHCIYQLLKSRAFTKNKVPIKNWIFQQLCNCRPPIHHILPSLIEAYVNSILLPTSQSAHMTNEPIAEEDLVQVFQRIVYSFEPDQIQKTDRNPSGDEESTDDDQNDSDNDSDDQERMDVDDDETENENDDSNLSTGNAKSSEESLNSVSCLLTSQLLFLYYVLLYEDVRLANIRNVDRPSMTYSSEFMSRLPIFYLIQRTQTCPEEYGLLRPPLLRLISFHYPHLCLVRDWLPRPNFSVSNHRSLFSLHDRHQVKQIVAHRKKLRKLFQTTLRSLKEKLYNQNREPFYYLEQLVKLPDELLWPFATDFIQLLPWILDVDTPKKILLLIRQIWFRLNYIFPTKLWVMTVNILRNGSINGFLSSWNQQNWEDIVMNPNFIFRCDQRVFRIPELMEILLHMIDGFLSASKIKCTHHNMECIGRHTGDEEKKKREELSRIYNLTWDSAAIQMLLDCCSPQIDQNVREKFYQYNPCDKVSKQSSILNHQIDCLLSNRREIQGLICTHLHQRFIADWNLAKTVSTQGYDPEFLPMAVAGIPSLHICLDFIPDILQYTDLSKQSFAIDLTSHLCVQYPIPRSFSIAKLCFEFANIHLTLLPNPKLCQFYLSILPALERMTHTFPPLIEGFLKLLIRLGQRNLSAFAAKPGSKFFLNSTDQILFLPSSSSSSSSYETISNEFESNSDSSSLVIRTNNKSLLPNQERFSKSKLIDISWLEFNQNIAKKMSPEESLALAIHKTFAMVCQLSSINRIYRDSSTI